MGPVSARPAPPSVRENGRRTIKKTSAIPLPPRDPQVARILDAAAGGDRRAAAQLLPLVYGELRRLARDRMRKTPPLTGSGQVVGRLKKPWRDGTTHFVLTTLAFLQRLCALVPRPRRPLITYHGVLAPASSWRPRIVPVPPPRPVRAHCNPPPVPAATVAKRKRPHRPWHPWADLMKRVFDIDLKVCPWCGGPRKQLAFITQPDVIRRILTCLDFDLAPPYLAPARELSHELIG